MLPQIGEILDGFRFVGGDPKKQESWEPFATPKPGDILDGYRFKGGNPSEEGAWESTGAIASLIRGFAPKDPATVEQAPSITAQEIQQPESTAIVAPSTAAAVPSSSSGLGSDIAEASKAGVYRSGAGLLDTLWGLAQSAENPRVRAAAPGPFAGVMEAARLIMPKDERGRAKRFELAKSLEDAAEAFAPELQKESFDAAWEKSHVLPWMVVQAAHQSPQIATLLASILVPAIAPVTLPTMGASAAGNQYAENVKAGVPQERAALDAAVNGLVEVLSEGVGFMIGRGAGEAFKRIHDAFPKEMREAAASSILARVAAAGGTLAGAGLIEGASEATGQVVQDLSQKHIAGRDPGDMAANARTAFFASLLPGAMFAAPKTAQEAFAAGRGDAQPPPDVPPPPEASSAAPAPVTAATVPLTGDVRKDIDAILAAPITPIVPAGAIAPADEDLGLAGPSPTVAPAPEAPDARALEDEISAVSVDPVGAQAPDAPIQPQAEGSSKEKALEVLRRAGAAIRGASPDQTRALTPELDRARLEAEKAGASPVEIIDAGRGVRTPNLAPEPEAKPEFEDFTTRRGELKTFRTEKQAALYQKQATNRVPGNYTPRRLGRDEWVLSRPYRERTPAQKANDERLKKQRTTVDPAKDSLATVMGKLGGLSLDELERDGFDPADRNLVQSGVFGRPALRRKGGLSLDAMAELLGQHGFDVLDEAGRPDASRVRELVDEILEGRDVYTPEGYEYWAARADEAAQARARAEALPDEDAIEASGYNELDADELAVVDAAMDDDLDDVAIDFEGKGAISGDEADREFGYTRGEGAAPSGSARPAPSGEAAARREDAGGLESRPEEGVGSSPAQPQGITRGADQKTAPSGAVSASGEKESFEARTQRLKDEYRALVDEVTRRFERDGIVIGEDKHGRRVLTRSTSGDAPLRVTSFLPDGTPSGHRDYTAIDSNRPIDSAAGEFRGLKLIERDAAEGDAGEEGLPLLTGDEAAEAFDPHPTLFEAPQKKVRLADKVKQYVKGHGWMSVDEAQKVIDGWIEHAQAQKRDPRARSINGNKVVLSLFDLTGKWAEPWAEAGYQVYTFDIQRSDEEDILKFGVEYFVDNFGMFEGADVHAVLAACPCTDFAVSGARHFAAKDADGRTQQSIHLVEATLATIEYFKPAVWAIENPVSRIEELGKLPPWHLSFDPNHVGHPYTKKTILWGRFNADLPIAPVEPTEGSKMWAKYGGKSQATKNARSETPEGFSYAFFMANNAVDHPALAIQGEYDRLDKRLLDRAVKAGLTNEEIGEAIDDFYYIELDDPAANAALRKLIAQKEKGDAETVRVDSGSGEAAPQGARQEPERAETAKPAARREGAPVLTNRDALKGKRVTVDIQVEGVKATLKVDADRILNLMDERVTSMKRVLACLSK